MKKVIVGGFAALAIGLTGSSSTAPASTPSIAQPTTTVVAA